MTEEGWNNLLYPLWLRFNRRFTIWVLKQDRLGEESWISYKCRGFSSPTTAARSRCYIIYWIGFTGRLLHSSRSKWCEILYTSAILYYWKLHRFEPVHERFKILEFFVEAFNLFIHDTHCRTILVCFHTSQVI